MDDVRTTGKKPSPNAPPKAPVYSDLGTSMKPASTYSSLGRDEQARKDGGWRDDSDADSLLSDIGRHEATQSSSGAPANDTAHGGLQVQHDAGLESTSQLSTRPLLATTDQAARSDQATARNDAPRRLPNNADFQYGGRASIPRHPDIESGKWQASTFDTSSLSEEKIAKLKKKGVNPALYLEMKAARGKRGRFSIPALTGNTFL